MGMTKEELKETYKLFARKVGWGRDAVVLWDRIWDTLLEKIDLDAGVKDRDYKNKTTLE